MTWTTPACRRAPRTVIGVGRRFAGGVPAWVEAPVIHPVARGGPGCRAVPGGSIKTGGRPFRLGEEARHRSELARACISRFGVERKLVGVGSCSLRQVVGRGLLGQSADLAIAQAVVAEGKDLPGERDSGELAAAAFGDPLVLGAPWAAAGVCCAASHRPSAGSWSPGGRCARDAPCRRSCGRLASAGPLAEVLGGGEAFDLADLGDDQHRGVAADPADLAEQLDALVGFGALIDLAARREARGR
jgi:hypothetical protein